MLLYTRIYARSKHMFGGMDGVGDGAGDEAGDEAEDEVALLAAAKELPEASGPPAALPNTPFLRAST